MDRFEGRCWLDWWANSTTNLGGVQAAVAVVSDDDGWHAHGHLVNADYEDGEGFAFLCALDPVFSLRFDDDSTIPVTVHPLDDPSHFQLAEYIGPTERPLDYAADLRPSTDPEQNDPPNNESPDIA